jgi:signal transduction histidine kinase
MKVQQAHRLMNAKSSGIGHGPAAVKQIIGQHGGAIDVDSELGCGISIAIRLPLKPEMRVAA